LSSVSATTCIDSINGWCRRRSPWQTCFWGRGCPSQAIHAATRLRIADALEDEPLRLDDLAGRVGADPVALSRLMRALISRGIFRQHRDGRYDLTPLADTLRVDAPVSTAGQALLIGSPQHREQ
jgi:C-methyltransferase